MSQTQPRAEDAAKAPKASARDRLAADGVLSPGSIWRNWSRSVAARPEAFAAPRDEGELRQVIAVAAEAGHRVRPVGAGHSFTPCAETSGIMVSLDAMSGLVRIDRERRLATVRAGTRLRVLFRLLDAEGLALENQGDIDRQSIAGAVSTGTHGTGLGFTGLAAMVRGMRLVTADGESRELSADAHPEELELARLSLGALGVVTELTLQCVEAFDLEARERTVPFDEAVGGFLERCAEVEHTEFYWFPHSSRAMLKENRRLRPDEASEARARGRVGRWFDEELVGNGAHRAALELGRALPAMVKPINRLSTQLMGGGSFREPSHSVFVSPRRSRFTEMEYAVPLEAVPAVVRELRAEIERRGWPIEFPIEVRAAKADDVPLSTAFERDSGYIAVHRFSGVRPNDYFREFQAIAREHGGRPHWGKLHTLDREELASEYRRLDVFCALRDRLDPERRFANGYLQRVLGA